MHREHCMLTVDFTHFSRHFGQYLQDVRLGHAVLVVRGGEPYCMLVHPSLLEDVEAAGCESVATTEIYRRTHQVCQNAASGQKRYCIMMRGHAAACLVGAEFLNRALSVK